MKDKPYFLVSADTLADWVEEQADTWWSVDGDPWLMSVVDFPCPSDELAPAIRKTGKDLFVKDWDPSPEAHGKRIGKDRLDEMVVLDERVVIGGRNPRRILQLSWEGSDDVEWLLMDDEAMVAN